MSFPGFTPADFKVFDIDGFKPRMEAIKTRIRPKLEAIGRDLLPDVGRIAGGDQAFAHVARHARRTVHAPDDTWVAFALDKRGYKKHCHFKVAVSRGAVRFLFEAGPEHARKKRWASAWKRQGPKLAPVLRRAKGRWCWGAPCRRRRRRAGNRATTLAPRARPSSCWPLSTGSSDRSRHLR